MSKAFFEVFGKLNLKSQTAGYFKDTVVERITSTRHRDYLRVYLTSDHLIPKLHVTYLPGSV